MSNDMSTKFKEMDIQDAKLEEAKAEINEDEEYVITCDDFHEVCRTCLLKTHDVQDANVEIEDIKVLNLLESYAGIKIDPNDELPRNICNNCLAQFLQFHVFVENCQSNDLYLKQLLDETLKCESPEGASIATPPLNHKSSEGPSITAPPLNHKSSEGLSIGTLPLQHENSEGVLIAAQVDELSLPQIIFVSDGEEIAPGEISDAGDGPAVQQARLPQKEEVQPAIKVEVQPTQSTLLKECLICTKICNPASQAKPTCRKLKTQKVRTPKFICEYCGKEFEQSCTLWNHRRLHTGRKKLAMSTSSENTTCKHCGKYFRNSTRYKIHLKREHNDEDATLELEFECKKCKKTYDSSAKLKKHQQNVHTNQRFLCPTCGKDFVRKVHLQTHLLVHTRERNYKCQICDKLFAHANSLSVHMFGHTGEKPHKCVICGKRFSRPQSLDVHMASHTGKKPFVCNICNKGFRQSTHLKTHIRTHSGERPYSCTHCEKSFTTSGSLTIHSRIHTKEKVYQCGVCPKGYYDLSNLKKHRKKHVLIAIRKTEVAKIPSRNSV